MRQSLSEGTGATVGTRTTNPVIYAAAVLSALVAVAAMIDQAGTRSLMHHAATVYASSGKQPSANLLYGLLYTVAIVEGLMWLLVRWAARSRQRLAGVLAVVAIIVSASFGLTLLLSSEYGSQVFPPLWGILATLPAIVGVFTVAPLFRR